MNTRFYNIRLLTMDGTMDVVPGEVWVEGNRISYAGPSAFMGDANTDAITPRVWDREIDGNGNLLMPGFKNAHTHSAMTCRLWTGSILRYFLWKQSCSREMHSGCPDWL